MAPPPGLFSMITGWPKLSDNFCPTIRAMMSLPPPGVKPTMMWIARVGYFEGSSWAEAEVIAVATIAIAPRHLPIGEREAFMGSCFLRRISEPCHVNMQHRGLAVIKCSEAPIDCGSKLIGLADAFAMRAEGAS